MAKYLYGARNDDWRYFDSFEERYVDSGQDFINTIKNSMSQGNKQNSLLATMTQGIANAKKLAEYQSRAFGYGANVTEFVKDYNELIHNFEYLAFTLLEQTSRFVAYDIVDKIEKGGVPMSLDKGIARAKDNKTTIKALENAISSAGGDFWASISGLVSSNSDGMKEELQNLVNLRSVEIMKGNDRYTGAYAGKLGELTVQLVLEGIANMTTNLGSEIQNQLRKGGSKNKAKIIGMEGNKADVKKRELLISVKNYTAIRNQFASFSQNTLDDKTKKKSAVDVTIQSSGSLENVINNFAKDSNTSILKGNTDDFYGFVMNAIYYREFGMDDYYQEAMQALDILVNAYAYTFLIQGTTKESGYQIQQVVAERTSLPGFIWFVGKGLVPMYEILEEIRDNFQIILNTTRKQGRSKTYGFLKLSRQDEAVSKVDTLRPINVYGEDQTMTNGMYYRSSSYYPKERNPETILTKRYSEFSNTIQTSIKLHLQMSMLQKSVYK